MSLEAIATSFPVVYVGASLVYYVYVAWEKCKAAFYWLTEPDEIEVEKPLRRIDSITIIPYNENENEVYV